MLYVWEPKTAVSLYPDNQFERLKNAFDSVLWLDIEWNNNFNWQLLSFLHPVTLERMTAVQPRGFLDEFDDYIHILLFEINYTPDYEVSLNPCHFIIGSNYLISCHQNSIQSIFTMQSGSLPIRFFNQGSDLLFYYVTQPMLSAAYGVLDSVAELTDDIEKRIFPKPDRCLLTELFNLKKDLNLIRKTLAPMREVFGLLARRENPFVDEQALPFMIRLYDESIRLHELSDTQREIVSGALEIYLTSASNRLNEVMMTLTIVSTIILPLTLIVGFYGMNFKYFKELQWPYGIPFIITLMVITTVGMVGYFKKKGWF